MPQRPTLKCRDHARDAGDEGVWPVIDLPCGDAYGLVSSGSEVLVAQTIGLEAVAFTVILPAIELDHELQVGPERVDEVACGT